MERIAHQIAIFRAMKGVVKLAKIADTVTADIGKLQNKCHSPHYEGNGKKIRRRNRKI